MFGKARRFGRLWGIELRLDASWVIIFVLVTWFLAGHYFPMIHSGWLTSVYWGLALVTSLLFFASILAHELAHGVVAKAQGVPVRDITLLIFGGVTRITQDPRRARDDALVALAGPAASFALGIGFGVLWWLSRASSGPFHAPTGWLGAINIALAAFNLIPGFPLDGGRVFRAVVWGITGNRQRATRIAARLGQLVAFGFIVWGIWLVFSGDWTDGLWMVFIGWYLNSAATSSYQYITVQEMLAGHSVREVMLRDCPRVTERLTLDVLMDQVIRPSGRRCFPVVDDGQLDGLVTLGQVTAVSRERWTSARVEDVMTARKDLEMVEPDEALPAVYERMTAEDIDQFPVVDDGQFVGVVGRDTVLAFIQARSGQAGMRGS